MEALDHVVRRLEHGGLPAVEAIDILLSEELTLRENSRTKTALRMGRIATIKTLAGLIIPFNHLSTGIASLPWHSPSSSSVTKRFISSQFCGYLTGFDHFLLLLAVVLPGSLDDPRIDDLPPLARYPDRE